MRCFQITDLLSTRHLPFDELDPNDVRVGFSLRSAPLVVSSFQKRRFSQYHLMQLTRTTVAAWGVRRLVLLHVVGKTSVRQRLH